MVSYRSSRPRFHVVFQEPKLFYSVAFAPLAPILSIQPMENEREGMKDCSEDLEGQDCDWLLSFLCRKMGIHHCKGGLEIRKLSVYWGCGERFSEHIAMLYSILFPYFVHSWIRLMNRQLTGHGGCLLIMHSV